MLCRNAWIPPGRGGKSLVTIKVLRIAADSTPGGCHGAARAGSRRGTGRLGRRRERPCSWPPYGAGGMMAHAVERRTN
ncbi:hypothetical protein GCM10009863_11740 [Streptomyces axinellae]|uniref:Uncharacterized protein n=1 Tax=Streptomyces axinellae TaxID=552788 RepID=A0ABN3PSN4_9ACTN